MQNDKVAIYGCSFSDPDWSDNHWMKPLAWSNLLKNDFSQVDNFAKGGSSVYYSYKEFLKTHQNYDKIIFSITTSGRWFMPFEIFDQKLFFNSVATLSLYYKQHKSQLDKLPGIVRKIKALNQYYLELENEEVSNDITDLILFKIKSLRPDTIFIPMQFWENTLNDFYSQFKPQERNRIIDLTFTDHNITCHLPEEYNYEVYQLVKDCLIHSKPWVHNTLPNKVKITHPLTHYFKIRT